MDLRACSEFLAGFPANYLSIRSSLENAPIASAFLFGFDKQLFLDELTVN